MDRYKVVIFLPDGFHETVGTDLTAEEAVNMAASYTRRPAALIGIIAKVIVTDEDDYTNFCWEFGKGVTFPRRNPTIYVVTRRSP